MHKLIDPNIFRAYDIRGIVGSSLTAELMYLLGQTLGSMALMAGEDNIALGFDGRSSSPQLASALGDGLLSTGCDVIDLGMIATPLLYYATHLGITTSGIMITGSHNPPEYNGCKIVMRGQALFGKSIKDLYHHMLGDKFLRGQGQYHELDIAPLYLTQIQQNITLQRPLNIVIDCGHGVAGCVAGDLYRALGCQVTELYCQIDATFPAHHPDPSEANNLQSLITKVLEIKADIGLAFDGDGDRLGVISNDGTIIWPDHQLILFALELLRIKPTAKIIYDIKCSNHVAEMINQAGGEAIMCQTGHSLIKAKLQTTGALLAGEMSGHIFFRDRWYGFDDALYAGARLLEIVSAQEQTVEQLFAIMPRSITTPEFKIAVSEEEKDLIVQQLIDLVSPQLSNLDAEMIVIDGLRLNFKQRGWGLVRASNTTPCLALRFEAATQQDLLWLENFFSTLILTVKPELNLPF